MKTIFDIYEGMEWSNMSKMLKSFMVGVIFMMGLSIGVYYGMSTQKEEKVEEKKPMDSVQDIVIKNVQSENNTLIPEEIEVVSNIERISPYAKMIIEKKYTKCGHTTVNILDVPKELINLSEEELKEKYSGWEVREFTPTEFTLYRLIDANCEDHFVIKENEGYVAVYNEVTEDVENLIKKTDILVEDLREEDKNDLEEGIKVFGQDRLDIVISNWEV